MTDDTDVLLCALKESEKQVEKLRKEVSYYKGLNAMGNSTNYDLNQRLREMRENADLDVSPRIIRKWMEQIRRFRMALGFFRRQGGEDNVHIYILDDEEKEIVDEVLREEP